MTNAQGMIKREIEKVKHRMAELERELQSLAAIELALVWAEQVNEGDCPPPTLSPYERVPRAGDRV